MANGPLKANLEDLVQLVLEHGLTGAAGEYDEDKLREMVREHTKLEYDNDDPTAVSSTKWSPNYDNLRVCNTVADVQAVIAQAQRTGKRVRAAGAQHSAPRAVFARDTDDIRIKLDGDLRKIEVLDSEDKSRLVVRVGAGCNLGIDPSDEQSNAENSLTRTADKLGYALPILGGMSHHTVGGFMMTSTAGGTIKHGFADSLLAFEIVDGRGNVRTLEKGSEDFEAAAVSMGLFGIVTHLTLELVPKYLVQGREQTLRVRDSMMASGAALKSACESHTYVHSVWFPQKGVKKVLEWTGEPVRPPAPVPLIPYEHPLENELKAMVAALALSAVNKLYQDGSPVSIALATAILNVVNPRDRKPQKFLDHWWRCLPNDDLANIDEIFRVQFTEVWLDLERTEEVYDKLIRLFDRDPVSAGNFGVEVYPGKESPFWMSHSFERNVIRIDPYWWEHNPEGRMKDYFKKFWNVLLRIPTARLHWGKHFPKLGSTVGGVTIGPDYVRNAYPRFDDWLERRKDFDPDQIFVTGYWRRMFGIEPV